MQITWEFHFGQYVWLEWIKNKRRHLKRFTVDGFNEFMAEEAELDFLN